MATSSLRKAKNSSRVLKGLETKRKLVQTAIELFAREEDRKSVV